jgi:8-oxo-dGTP pyrophosphatase MutT (NUDIX family)
MTPSARGDFHNDLVARLTSGVTIQSYIPENLMAIAPAELPVIKAAGGILLRSTQRGDEVMIVYRKRYQDWTLPKGKLQDGESFPEAALREVEEETGCSCRLGAYLGAISYAYNGVPKVVMFWKMAVIQEKPLEDTGEISEAVWMPVPTAMQRMTHAQEKSLLARVAGAPRTVPSFPTGAASEPAPVARAAEPEQAPALVPIAKTQQPRQRTSREEQNAHAQLSREMEAFRVELAFLERRSQQADRSWLAAAGEHLRRGKSCLDHDDIDGGLQSLQAARRYSLRGLNALELAGRAQILREEARKITSWRSGAIQRLLALSDEKLSAARVVDATALRDEDVIEQQHIGRIADNRLRALLMTCGLGVALLLLLMLMLLVQGWPDVIASVLLFGLLGSTLCAAQSLINCRSESRMPRTYIMLAPVLLGAMASLAGYAVHQYLVSSLDPGQAHTYALLALAFLFGCLGERVLARFTVSNRQLTAVRP